MRTSQVLVALFALSACGHRARALPDHRTAVPARATDDSVQILHAAWRVATEGHRAQRAAVFWAAAASDTGRFVRLSPAVLAGVARLGVPLESRDAVGEDTLHVRVTRWTADSSAQVLEVHSSWTTILRGGGRACRTGSVNVESLRVSRTPDGWKAEQAGPVLHGDRECVRVPPA